MHFCCSYIFAELDENSSKVKNPFIKHENDHDANLVPLSVPWRFWEYPPPPSQKNLGIPRKMYENERDIIVSKKIWEKRDKDKKLFIFR